MTDYENLFYIDNASEDIHNPDNNTEVEFGCYITGKLHLSILYV